MKRIQRWTMFGAMTGLVGASAVACDAVTERLPFVAPALSDGSALAEASLPPEGGPIVDAGARPIDASDVTVTCATTPCALELTAGERHFCARMSDGTARCWGDATRGAIGQTARDLDAGDASARDAATPDPDFALEPLLGISDAKEIRAGGWTTCVLDGAGKVLCWGVNDWGQLGLSAGPTRTDYDAHPTPTPVDLSGVAERLEVARFNGCAFVGGHVECWGGNQYRQLSRDTTVAVAGPAPTHLDASKVERVVFAETAGFALTSDARLLSWGAISAIAGRASSVSADPYPELATSLSGVTDFAVWTRWPASIVYGQACAVANGKFYCWGDNSQSTLCTGIPDTEPNPVELSIPDESIPSQVAASQFLTCIRSTNGKVHCCGEGNRGQMGTEPPDGSMRTKQDVLVHVPLDGVAAQVATSASTACILLTDGSVECWGSNAFGELGQGTKDDVSHPKPTKVKFR
ncbi:RCC1 domain-containing protein [Labilithrix luteola]|nr:hypothetical protein [Labilithrix luteola]